MTKLLVFFQRNSLIFGVVIALILPVITALILYPIFTLFVNNDLTVFQLPISKYLILGCVPALFIARYYLKREEYENSGKGALFTTLILIGVNVVCNHFSIF